jgi:SAM-dependent methyltransferase
MIGSAQMTQYDDVFFDYVNSGALRSAKRFLPALLSKLNVSSVLDVGCGQGAWLSVWKDLGISTTVGIDGAYVNKDRLLCPRESFMEHDLSQPFDLGRRFELVQSLEVAEHLPAESAPAFVASLVRHGDVILFSAAPKGQGGDHHVNEQNYDYWRRLFARHDYVAVDFLRREVLSNAEIEPWYRYNSILYVAKTRLASLPDAVSRFVVADHLDIPDVSPLPYKLRKLVIRTLPVPVMTRLAKLKERRTAQKLRAAS